MKPIGYLSTVGYAAFAAVLFAASAAADAAGSAPSVAGKARKVSPYRTEKLTRSSRDYYKVAWGVDQLKVSEVSSGNLIRFTYRITDARLAKPLTDRNETPYLYAQRARALLGIPHMEKVGPLRQIGAPQVGKVYWMTFSNKGRLVRPGDRVNVIVGALHIDGLRVE